MDRFTQRPGTLPTPYLIVLSAAIFAAVLYVYSAVFALLGPGIPPGFADKDFANYWTAANLMFEGKTIDLFGPQPVYFAHLRAAFGDAFPWHNWSYPPHFLLLIWPLGFFGYKAALLIFMAVTGALFAIAYRAFIGERSLIAWVAVGPFIAHNFWIAQNGYLSTALALGALALRDRRPVVAGILLGLLTIKPQLGLLFPFLLLAERRWTVIASAVVSTISLVGLSAAIFGVDAWRGYFTEVLPYQTFVMRNLEGTFLTMMPSVYAALRNWTVGPGPALALHVVVAAPIAVILIAALFRTASAHDRDILVLTGTFIITPYALTYDLGLFAAALGLMATRNQSTWPEHKARITLLALAMLLPVGMMLVGAFRVPLAPPIVLAVFLVALRDTGLSFAISRRLGGGDKLVTAPSPAAASD
ncbi:glycosyltransferase family 87 protein [Mesorhizobium sp. WSM4884]|uniref:glycosyltransferase family 87 protein n=1 Tax=Mesorhizobium sp. WSM4884 TaxID=3038542 RepID=UPI002416CED8|nr:glycosyltransferase family 87 protein [Mesorhizobium sp. WSM4884]MDG4885605.1 glycosyltransferase family 87 protein [Mesorhizobium sp. WSM4884]